MYRWSKIPEEHRPEIISDISNDKSYTFKLQDYYGRKIKRKDLNTLAPPAGPASHAAPGRAAGATASIDVAWEGYYFYDRIFKNIINKNIPCTLMHKVKNKWAPGIDTVVCFMTGDTFDVFLVHPDDLMEWDPDEEINND